MRNFGEGYVATEMKRLCGDETVNRMISECS